MDFKRMSAGILVLVLLMPSFALAQYVLQGDELDRELPARTPPPINKALFDVIDNGSFESGTFPPWRTASPDFRRLIGMTNSGAVFEIDTINGTVWPLCTLAGSYTEWEFDPAFQVAWAQLSNGSFSAVEFDLYGCVAPAPPVPNGAAFNGLEYIGGTLYGAGIVGPGAPADLYTVDAATGVTALIGPLGTGRPMSGLAYDPSINVLYGIDGGGNSSGTTSLLWTVDPNTAATSPVGDTGVIAGSLEIGPDGGLYAGDAAGDIWRIDPNTAVATFLTSASAAGLVGAVSGLALVEPGYVPGGQWYVSNSPTGPVSGLALQPPTDGSFQAVTDMSGPGTNVLFQDLAIPSSPSVSLILDLWWSTTAAALVDRPTLDFGAFPNQHFRIDIMDPAAPLTDVGVGVWQNLLLADGTFPLASPATTYSWGLTAFAGQTVRLRIVEVDNQGFLNVGVDLVRLQSDIANAWVMARTPASSGPMSVFSIPDGTGNAMTQAQFFGGPPADATIEVQLFDGFGSPIVNFPATELSLESSLGGLEFCFSYADGITDALGVTRFQSPLFVGGASATSVPELMQVRVDGIVSPEHVLYNPRMVASGHDGTIYEIDLATGAATPICTVTGAVAATEIEYDPSTGEAILADANLNASVRFDPDGCGSLGPYQPTGGLSFNGLEYVDGVLFGTGYPLGGPDANLYRLDPVSGIPTLVGPAGLGKPISGMAYNPVTEVMYGVTGGALFGPSELVWIDLGTGAANIIAPTGLSLSSLEFGPDAQLYAGGNSLDGANLYRIDPSNGNSVLVGPTGISSPSGQNSVSGLALLTEKPQRQLVLLGTTVSGSLFELDLASGTVIPRCPLPNPALGYTEIEYDFDSGVAWGQAGNGTFTAEPFDPFNCAPLGPPVPNGAAFNGMEFAEGVLYGAGILSGGGIFPADLYTIDPATGVTNLIGPLGTGRPMSGLAYDERTGQMYGIDGGKVAGPSNLWAVDRFTGATTLIGNTQILAGSLELGPDRELYAGDDMGDIWHIDRNSAVATFVASGSAVGLADAISGLALAPGGSAVGLHVYANSADIDGNLRVDLADVGVFSIDFNDWNTRGIYHYRSDFSWDGLINLQDLGSFALGLGRLCVPPPKRPSVVASTLPDAFELSFDPEGDVRQMNLEPGEEVRAYLRVRGPATREGIAAWEAALRTSPNVSVRAWELADGSLNLGEAPEFIVGLGQHVRSESDAGLSLLTLRLTVEDDRPAFVLVEGISRPSVAPGFPALAVGSEMTLQPARTPGREAEDPALVINGSGGASIPELAGIRLRAVPNPFNPATEIRFELPRKGEVEVGIYDATGRLVRRLSAGVLAAGPHALAWNGTDQRGHPVVSGVYFYQLQLDGREIAPPQKMSLLK